MRDFFLLISSTLFVLGSCITSVASTAERLFLGMLLSSLSLGVILLTISHRVVGSLCLLSFLTLDALLFLYTKTLPVTGARVSEKAKPSAWRIGYTAVTVWFFFLFLVGVYLLIVEIMPGGGGISVVAPVKLAERIWGAGWFYASLLILGATSMVLVGMGMIERKKSEH